MCVCVSILYQLSTRVCGSIVLPVSMERDECLNLGVGCMFFCLCLTSVSMRVYYQTPFNVRLSICPCGGLCVCETARRIEPDPGNLENNYNLIY